MLKWLWTLLRKSWKYLKALLSLSRFKSLRWNQNSMTRGNNLWLILCFLRRYLVDAKFDFNHILFTNNKIMIYRNWFMQVTYQNSKTTSWIISPYLLPKEIHTCHTITHNYGHSNAASSKRNTNLERKSLKTKKLLNKNKYLKINKNEIWII